ncbi:MAG: hypothetical protein IID43_02815 [Planctomycetes bacterium]|nr:hypothetical protein [Planctomycetota bacterium]
MTRKPLACALRHDLHRRRGGRHGEILYEEPMMKKSLVLCLLFCATVLASSRVDAGERRFTYVYEATTLQKGEWEFEQWVTWKTAKETNRDFDRFDFRTEIEYGVTDHFQLGFYLSDWRYEENRPKGKHRGDWRDVAVEAIWNLTDPNTDPVGLALYGEVKIGDALLELEGKLIVQKNFGKIALAYNATIEAEWEGHHFDEDKGELQQTVGLSYQFSPRFLVGMELLHEIAIPDWRGASGKGVLYVGPNFSYRTRRWWATLTPLFQVSDVEDEPDFQMRLIFGMPLGG